MSRSVTRRTARTVPCCSKNSRTSSSVASKDRFPTYSVFAIFFSLLDLLLKPCRPDLRACSGSSSVCSHWPRPASPTAVLACLSGVRQIHGSGRAVPRRREQKKRAGSVLLSRTLTHSIIAAGVLNRRVRDGNGCCLPAMATSPEKGHCTGSGIRGFPQVRLVAFDAGVFCFFPPCRACFKRPAEREKRWSSLTAD